MINLKLTPNLPFQRRVPQSSAVGCYWGPILSSKGCLKKMSDCHHNNCHKIVIIIIVILISQIIIVEDKLSQVRDVWSEKKTLDFFRMNIWFHISCQITDYQISSVVPRKKFKIAFFPLNLLQWVDVEGQ